jgi:hypothetical protein
MRYVIHGKTTAVAGAMRCKKLMMPHRAVPATLQMQPHVGTENLVAPGQTRRRRLPRHRSHGKTCGAHRGSHRTKRMECWARQVRCVVEVLSVGHHRM